MQEENQDAAAVSAPRASSPNALSVTREEQRPLAQKLVQPLLYPVQAGCDRILGDRSRHFLFDQLLCRRNRKLGSLRSDLLARLLFLELDLLLRHIKTPGDHLIESFPSLFGVSGSLAICLG